MPLVHDTAYSISDIFDEIVSNLNESRLQWFTESDIIAAIQEAYNKIVALLCPIEYSTFIPQKSGPYYNLAEQIPDYMYVSGIYNPTTNLWLEGRPYKLMKQIYQSYINIGEPKWFNIIDINRVLIWPYLTTATGVLYLVYKAKAPIISMSHIPILPHSVAGKLLEYFATADLMEQAREFKKASMWWDKLFVPPKGEISLFDQAAREIKSLARADRELVLEPYRWMFHGGDFNVATWISNETPSGSLNGINATFTLAQTPNPTASLMLMKNGQILFNGNGYTLSGQTIIVNSTFIPNNTDAIRAWYQVA